MTFEPDGSLIEMEQQVSPENLASPVSAAIRQAGRGGNVGKIESVTRGRVVTEYETTMTRNGLRREAAFGPDGARRAAV
jgi:hypothetical protein